MDIYHVLAFIAGGFMAAVLFVIREHKKRKERAHYLAVILSYQFHSGMHFNQENPDKYIFEYEQQVMNFSAMVHKNFIPSAHHCLDTLEKL